MRKYILFQLLILQFGCSVSNSEKSPSPTIVARLDLVNVQNDKIKVIVDPGTFSLDEVTFRIPKTVPGTYSEDNFGRLIEEFRALDREGRELPVMKNGINSWNISKGRELAKVEYLVNDTYDVDGELGIFSPAGISFDEGEVFMLNLHGMVGYFDGLENTLYQIDVDRPSALIAASSLPMKETISKNGNYKTDVFNAGRYFDVTDNPIMYSVPDTATFETDNMEVLISIYSPNGIHSTGALKGRMEKMIRAQKEFLGDIDNTSKYAILLYLSDPSNIDAKGFGALEHHTSTVVNFSESMSSDQLQNSMTDVVSHEFFHILTPLNVHSEQIHHFNYNDPQMSKHLWMYEGVTEYFAHLFQVNQGLIDEEDFFSRMSEKIKISKNYDETVPFTLMSENILKPEYNSSFYNVYHKGALIAMALDIHLRSMSNGNKGLLHIMKDLSKKYGKDRPFQDDKLFQEITDLSHPEIQDFFNEYVMGKNAIPYNQFFEKVGLEIQEVQLTTGYLVKDQEPYIDINRQTGDIFFRKHIPFNSFLNELGVNGGDIIKTINGEVITAENAGEQIRKSFLWKEGDPVKILIDRNGQELELNGKVIPPTSLSWKLVPKNLPDNSPAVRLRNQWLKA